MNSVPVRVPSYAPPFASWLIRRQLSQLLKAPSANKQQLYVKTLVIFHASRRLKSGVRNCRQRTGKTASKYFSGHLFFYRSKKDSKLVKCGAIVSDGQEHNGFPLHL